MKSLVEENFIVQDENTRRYFLGRTLFELGLSASQRFNYRDLYLPILSRVAAETGDTVFLNVRSKNEVVCLDRMNGSFPIKVFTLDVGGRRRLGTSASGLAILSALPDKEVQSIVEENELAVIKYKNKSLKRKVLSSQIQKAREQGYAVHQGDLADVRAIAVAILNKEKAPFAAISVTAISSRMTEKRIREVAQLLKKAALELGVLLRDMNMAGTPT